MKPVRALPRLAASNALRADLGKNFIDRILQQVSPLLGLTQIEFLAALWFPSFDARQNMALFGPFARQYRVSLVIAVCLTRQFPERRCRTMPYGVIRIIQEFEQPGFRLVNLQLSGKTGSPGADVPVSV